jgi:mono/diheme cytochrome c family protein
MNIHRAIGFTYIVIYILMMTEMIPRLWEYQVEFPARTVAHILLGATIGVILILKVSIIRFFRHFEEWMPFLGVSLLLCSVLLGAMSLPAFFRERALAANALGGSVYSAQNRERVAGLLPKAGYPEGTDLVELSTQRSLEKGRQVLLGKCIACHDLKTIIAKPRTPENWVRVCKRMVEKPSIDGVITPEEGHVAAAYLVAITPDLQKSAKEIRQEKEARENAIADVEEVLEPDEGLDGVTDAGPAGTGPVTDATTPVDPKDPTADPDSTTVTPTTPKVDPEVTPPKVEKPKPPKPKFNFKEAKALFNEECSQCHDTSDVDDEPPTTRKEVNQMLARMVRNGLDLEKDELAKIRIYIIRTYLKKK